MFQADEHIYWQANLAKHDNLQSYPSKQKNEGFCWMYPVHVSFY